MKDDKKQNESVQEPQAFVENAARNPGPVNETPTDPFDPMNLGISTDYAAAINAQPSNKPIELRKPNDQEFFRTTSLPEQRLTVGAIADKQDMSRIYVVAVGLVDELKMRFPKAVRGFELVLTQTLVGTALLWPVPLAEDRGGKWNSSQRAACAQGITHWTNMMAGRGQYDCETIDNPKLVNWKLFPPMREILRQACSERLVDSLEHPLLRKLRGEIE